MKSIWALVGILTMGLAYAWPPVSGILGNLAANSIRRGYRLVQNRNIADLYYTPTSCGAASYIAAYKAGILGDKLKSHQVDIKSHKILTGPNKDEDFYCINPKGNVPAIVLEDKTLLNENSAVLQWIADQNPSAELAPPNGSSARYVLQSKLSYLASEVHAPVAPLFHAGLSSDTKHFLIKTFKSRLEYMSKCELRNGSKKYLLGDNFTIADAYLYIILTWLDHIAIDVNEFPVMKKYFDDVSKLDFIGKARKAMASDK